jgi:hypothetical protein
MALTSSAAVPYTYIQALVVGIGHTLAAVHRISVFSSDMFHMPLVSVNPENLYCVYIF